MEWRCTNLTRRRDGCPLPGVAGRDCESTQDPDDGPSSEGKASRKEAERQGLICDLGISMSTHTVADLLPLERDMFALKDIQIASSHRVDLDSRLLTQNDSLRNP